MATQAEWFSKLKGWLPEWFFEREVTNTAVFQATAKILADVQADMVTSRGETFLDNETNGLLDLMGSEREIDRFPNETDDSYRERVRYIENTTGYTSLLAIITAALNNGVPTLIENWAYGFADDELFCDCDDMIFLSRTRQINRFTVIIPIQTVLDHTNLKTIIVAAIDDKKALGVFADILYRTA